MTYRARLRVEVPDVPGALGLLGRVLGEVGGNLIAIDVQEVDANHAVDELLVDLPDELDLPRLGRLFAEAGAGVLLGATPGAAVVDPIVRCVRWAAAMLAASEAGGVRGADDETERAVAEMCGTAAVWLATADQARTVEAGRLALERGKPVALRTNAAPARLGPQPTDDVWLLAASDARLDPSRVAFVARPAGDRFAAAEVERIESILALRRLIVARLSDPRASDPRLSDPGFIVEDAALSLVALAG